MVDAPTLPEERTPAQLVSAQVVGSLENHRPSAVKSRNKMRLLRHV
jgi:hypothetical protein